MSMSQTRGATNRFSRFSSPLLNYLRYCTKPIMGFCTSPIQFKVAKLIRRQAAIFTSGTRAVSGWPPPPFLGNG